MALVTSGDDDIISLELDLYRVGVWTANVLFDDPNPRSGRVTISVNDGAETYVGTIDRGNEFEDVDRTRVVAGAGGMGNDATARQYQNATVRVILGDLVRDAGETLSSTAEAGVMSAAIDAWTTSAEPVGVVVSALMRTVGGGALWRMLPDGTLWVGHEAWADSGIDPSLYDVLDKRFEDGSWMVAVSEGAAAALKPGATFEGSRVSMVVHRIDDEEAPGPRMRIWFSDPDEGPLEDRLLQELRRFVNGAPPPVVDYRAMYNARVVAQSGSTVHVEPEILGALPDMGSLKLYVGLPGISMDGVQAGSVLVGWRAGDRSKPYALCFDLSNTVNTMTIAVLSQLLLGAADAPAALVGAPHQAAERTLIKQLAAAFSTLAGVCTTPPLSALAAGFGAVGTALTTYQTAAAAANNFLSKKVGISL